MKKGLLLIVIALSINPPSVATTGINNKITVAGITGKPPLEYRTAGTVATGAYVEIWKLWSRKTGVEVNYIVTTREQAERALIDGSVDVIMAYPPSPESPGRFILIPDIYRLDLYIYSGKRISPVEKIHDLRPFRTGITVTEAIKFRENNYDISFEIKKSVSELIEAHAAGEINVFIAEGARANYLLINRTEWRNFVQSSEPVLRYSVMAAVRNTDKELAETIASGFSRISEKERHVVEKTWSGGDIKYRIPWGYVGTVAVILIIIGGVSAIWWWNFQLQRKVDSATVELKAMKEEAEAASLAKSRFLDNISHELRTPLTLILAPVEDAINGRPLERDTLEMIRRNSRNLLSLINDLLDLSRITAGKMNLKVSETDLCYAVKLYCAEVESVADYNGISLSCSVPDRPVEAFIDSVKFSGIISNFFSNSLKFTEKGGKIDVCVEQGDGEVILRFSDNGPGIPADRLGMIFDRFSQVEPPLSRIREGSGIGLSIVKEVVELHGGSVSVESRYIGDHPDDHGVDFYVRIPSGRAHLDGRDDVEFDESAKNSLSLPFLRGIIKPGASDTVRIESIDPEADRASVLIVEDNIDMRFFLEGLLGGIYDVCSASNGAEALELLAMRESIDLILSDVMMPVMDGHELLVRINTDERFSGIPVIFLTARCDDLVKHQGLELGAVDYVVKPFNPDELLLRVRNQIQLSIMRNDLKIRNEELYSKLREKVQADVRKTVVTDEMKVKIDSVCSFIAENYRNDLSREIIAATIGINPDLFSRVFNQHTGQTLPDYINSFRIDEARTLLNGTDKTISRIAIETGFENLRTFNRVFRKFTGMSPSGFREGVSSIRSVSTS